MATDPSIALGYRAPQINLDVPSPIQQFGQMMSLRGLMEQSQMRRMQMEQERMQLDTLRQANAGEAEFRRRLGAGEALTPAQTVGVLGSQRGVQYLKGAAELEKTQHEANVAKWNRIGSIIGSATDTPTYNRSVMQLQSEGLYDPETARNLIERGFDPGFVKQAGDWAMSRKEQADLALRQAEATRQEAAEKRAVQLSAPQLASAQAKSLEDQLGVAAQTAPNNQADWDAWRAGLSPELQKRIPAMFSPVARELVVKMGVKPTPITEYQKAQEEQKLWTEPGGLISIINDPNRSDADKQRARAGLQQHESLKRAGATTMITPNQNIANEAKLRDDYYRDSKEYVTVRNAYNKIVGAAKSGTAAGDISLIYGFMRMQDPGSTVREGEFATAQNAGGIPERIRTAYNNAIRGERLDPNVRADFVTQADKIHGQSYADYLKTKEMYTGIATRGGMDPRNVVIDYSTAAPPQAGAHVIEVNGKRYRYKGSGATDDLGNYTEVKK